MTKERAISHLKDISMWGIVQADEYMALKMAIEKLQEKPKKGRWITWKEADNIIPSETRFECSVCHDAAYTLCNGLDLLSDYCPNCGANMREVEK